MEMLSILRVTPINVLRTDRTFEKNTLSKFLWFTKEMFVTDKQSSKRHKYEKHLTTKDTMRSRFLVHVLKKSTIIQKTIIKI